MSVYVSFFWFRVTDVFGIGVYLTDLTFTDDGNPKFLDADDQLINLTKCQKLAEVRLSTFQQATPSHARGRRSL